MCYNILEIENAGMAELADAQDLGSCEAIRVGSTPTTRTIERISEPYIVWGTVFVQTKRHSLP